MFKEKNSKLYYCYDHEIVCIEPWGDNALRIRATKSPSFSGQDWALQENIGTITADIKIHEDNKANSNRFLNMHAGKNLSHGKIQNGKISAIINANGVITFYNQYEKILLKEHWRRLQDDISMALNIPGRQYKPKSGESYQLTTRFCANKNEKIFGMGQYQQQELNRKGCLLELAQRNSQASVPFYLSNLGYGFLWNNPSVGQVMFAQNETVWQSVSAKEIDYVIIAGDSPSEIEETYMNLVGKPPMMPEYGMGFWQSKLRYRTQEELLTVARKYKEIKIPLDVIVADFFHWTQQGDYRFDPQFWPDVPAMCQELEEMGTKLMVSIWPTVDHRSENYQEMLEKGYLVQCESGVRISMLCNGNEVFFDATNPEAREYIWEKVKRNYWEQGIKLFWLDVAEPEYTTYEFENYRYSLGNVAEVGNIYPVLYAKGFYDGMQKAGDPTPLSLIRCAWAGSAKYGSLVWSGDIDSSFECLNRQVRAGLSMAVAGIPWWTTDIAGFHGGHGDDPVFRELLIRWFQYACFCPVMRLHGNRMPYSGYDSGIAGTGADNEIWSFGEEVFEITKQYIFLRKRLRDYIRVQMEKTNAQGTPIMRPLFYDFPQDTLSWEIDDNYLFGSDLLVAPILESGADIRQVYLPPNTNWIDVWSKREYNGGKTVTVNAPLEQIPVFAKKNAEVLKIFDV